MDSRAKFGRPALHLLTRHIPLPSARFRRRGATPSRLIVSNERSGSYGASGSGTTGRKMVVRGRRRSSSPVGARARELPLHSGNANSFFLRTRTPALKRSSSARSEGAIQGAIALCKRSVSQQQQQGMISARRSVSDLLFYSVSNTPRVSSVAAANDAAQERQEMCRG